MLVASHLLISSLNMVHILSLFHVTDTLHTDVRDTDDLTPLHWACRGGNRETVQYLVEDLQCNIGESVGVVYLVSVYICVSCSSV